MHIATFHSDSKLFECTVPDWAYFPSKMNGDVVSLVLFQYIF